MQSKNKFRSVVVLALLGVASFASATEWNGTMSCGELQNSPGARSVAPFTAPVTLTIEGKNAVLDRKWATGKEQLQGSVSRGQPLKLEGLGWFFNNEAGAWKKSVTLVELGPRYEGTGTMESRDGKTKYRDCTVSVVTSDTASASVERKVPTQSTKISPGNSPSVNELLNVPRPREVQRADFWDEIRAAVGNRNSDDPVSDVRHILVNSLMLSNTLSEAAFGRTNDNVRCTDNTPPSNFLYRAADSLVSLLLPEVQEAGYRTTFQNEFQKFSSSCPAEVVRGGKAFLDKLSGILTAARQARIDEKRAIEAAKAQAYTASVESAKRQEEQRRAATAVAREAVDREQATRREAEERKRLAVEALQNERIAAFKSGKFSVDQIASQIQSNAMADQSMVSVHPGFEIVPGVYVYYWTDRFREKGFCQFEFKGKGPPAADGVRKWRLVYGKTRTKEFLATESFFGSDSPVRMYFDRNSDYTEFKGTSALQLSEKVAERIQNAREVKLVHGFSGSNEISYIYDMSTFGALRKVAQKLCS